MKIFELRNDQLVIQWLDNINKPNTINSYLSGLQNFTEWTGKTPDELITEAEEESKLLMRKRKITGYLIGFKKYLQEQSLAPLSQKSYFMGVKAFYQFNYIDLPKLKSDNAKPLRQNRNIPNKEDLQDVLKVCDPLEKAILLCGAASGLSANELTNLRVNDFKTGYDPETGITTLDLRRQKVELDFVTFLTPEASAAVTDYLSYRNRAVKTKEIKRLKQLEKQKVFSDSNYLFITRKVADDFLIDHDDEKRKIDKNTFMKLYRDISEKAQKITAAGNWNLIRSHNIRKYFNSTLLNAGMGFFYVEEMMGHTLPSTQEHYYRANKDKLREMYAQYIPYLTITKPLDITDSHAWQEMKNENVRLRALAEKYFIDGLELINARAEIQKLKFEKMTPEEKRIAIVDWADNLNPENDNERRLKDELKKALGTDNL